MPHKNIVAEQVGLNKTQNLQKKVMTASRVLFFFSLFPNQKRKVPTIHRIKDQNVSAGQLQGSGYAEQEPEFLSPLENLTVAQGRDVHFTCTVNRLSTYKVSSFRTHKSYTIVATFSVQTVTAVCSLLKNITILQPA